MKQCFFSQNVERYSNFDRGVVYHVLKTSEYKSATSVYVHGRSKVNGTINHQRQWFEHEY